MRPLVERLLFGGWRNLTSRRLWRRARRTWCGLRRFGGRCSVTAGHVLITGARLCRKRRRRSVALQSALGGDSPFAQPPSLQGKRGLKLLLDGVALFVKFQARLADLEH